MDDLVYQFDLNDQNACWMWQKWPPKNKCFKTTKTWRKKHLFLSL